MTKPLPPIDEKDRLYGRSGYTGADAQELRRQADKARDVVITEDLFLTVCDRLIQGENLNMICADPTMPSRPTVMRYLYKNEKALELYYAARAMQAETLADEMLAVANDDSQDFSIDPKTGRRVSHNDVVQRSRLKVDALTRTIAALNPKRFGNKQLTQIQGDANQPVTIQVISGVKRGPNSLIRGEPGELAAPKIIEGEVVRSIKDVE